MSGRLAPELLPAGSGAPTQLSRGQVELQAHANLFTSLQMLAVRTRGTTTSRQGVG